MILVNVGGDKGRSGLNFTGLLVQRCVQRTLERGNLQLAAVPLC